MAHFNRFFEAIDAKVDGSEIEWADKNVLIPLNNMVKAGALANGWNYVGGVAALFANGGHGYCAAWPYAPENYPGNPFSGGPQRVPYPTQPGIAWFRTAWASSIIQGPPKHTMTIGTLHPNELGLRAVSEVLLANLQLPVKIAGIGDGMEPLVSRGKEPAINPSTGWQKRHEFGLPGLYTNWQDLGGCVGDVCISSGVGGVGPLAPFFPPIAGSVEADLGFFSIYSEGNPLNVSTTVEVGIAEIYVDARTGALLAFNSGNGWVDTAGNVLIGNPLEAVKNLYGLFGEDEEPVKRTPWWTSDNCPYTNWLTAMAHQAEIDNNVNWLIANGFEQTFHYYSTERCYPLKEWQPSQADTDQDGLIDYSEMHTFPTDPYNADTDNDGLTDGYEYFTARTYFHIKDTDADGFDDKAEDDWWLSLSPEAQDQAFARDPDWPPLYFPKCLADFYNGRPYQRHPGLCAHIHP